MGQEKKRKRKGSEFKAFPTYAIGTRVSRYFDAYREWYEGTIVSHNGWYYHIHYNDGDKEDLDEHECQMAVRNYRRQHGTAQKQNFVTKPATIPNQTQAALNDEVTVGKREPAIKKIFAPNTPVARYFSSRKSWYNGIIVYYESPYFHVQYDDGDEEDLSETECNQAVRDYTRRREKNKHKSIDNKPDSKSDWTDEEVHYTKLLIKYFVSGQVSDVRGREVLLDYLTRKLQCPSSRIAERFQNTQRNIKFKAKTSDKHEQQWIDREIQRNRTLWEEAKSLADKPSRDTLIDGKVFKIGTPISRYFEGLGEWWDGSIVGYNGPFYHIKYSDGDEEDLDETECCQAVDDCKWRHSKPPAQHSPNNESRKLPPKKKRSRPPNSQIFANVPEYLVIGTLPAELELQRREMEYAELLIANFIDGKLDDARPGQKLVDYLATKLMSHPNDILARFLSMKSVIYVPKTVTATEHRLIREEIDLAHRLWEDERNDIAFGTTTRIYSGAHV